ncbi:hypothetical protein E2320_000050, partial [Naja naja]
VSSSSFEEQIHNPPPEKESSLTPATEISVGAPSANSSPPPAARGNHGLHSTRPGAQVLLRLLLLYNEAEGHAACWDHLLPPLCLCLTAGSAAPAAAGLTE